MRSALRNLGAITLFVEDLERSKEFYRTVFRLNLVFEDAHSAAFDFGNTIINVLQVDQAEELITPAPVGGSGCGVRAQLTVWVDDTDAVCESLVQQGIPLLNGPIDRPWGQRTAAFADPAGTVWEVAQQIGSAPQ